jgi:exosortase/archaeosortase family protein
MALCRSVTRNEFFALLYIVGCANGLLGRAILTVQFSSWEGAISGIDINVIVLLACFAGISMVGGRNPETLRPLDFAAAVVFLLFAGLPIFPLSWVGVTGLSLYILFFANADADRARGAFILLALTVPMLWSRLLFQMFAKTILNIDAGLVSLVLGTGRLGNMVQFLDQSGYMVVMPRCSSLANMSLALLCWATITQWVRHRWRVTDMLWGGLACLTVITVNVSRISIMGLSRGHYDYIHNDWGDLITNSIMLVLMVAVTVVGARREIFSRA